MTSTRRRIGSPDDRKRAGARGQRTRDGCPRRWFGATVQTITTWRVCAVLALLSVGVADAGEITVPAGFRIDVFAENVGGARALAVDSEGVLVVSISSRGRVLALPAGRGAVVRYNADGSGEQLFATGLRNPVGLAFHPTTAALWTTVNERDWPDGGAPPDYVTEVRHGAVYGWPQCFAERRTFLRDPTFAGAGGCRTMTLPSLELPPHAAPLGLVFYTGGQFPSAYSGDLFVALHGSRAGLPPSGYKIARVRFRHGHAAGVEDFSTGWRHRDRVLGRPVDLVLGRDGSLYVSDDHADRIHRVSYAPR